MFTKFVVDTFNRPSIYFSWHTNTVRIAVNQIHSVRYGYLELNTETDLTT